MLVSLFFAIVFVFVRSVEGCGYQNIRNTDKAFRPPSGSVSVKPINSKRLLGQTGKTLHPFRVGLYYNILDAYVAENPTLSSKSSMIKRVYARLATYLQTYLSVNYYDAIQTGSFYCGKNNFEAGLSGNFDLIVLVYPENDPQADYIAAAGNCVDSPDDGRPLVGMYYLNFAFININPR